LHGSGGLAEQARGDEAAAKLKSEGGEVGYLEVDLGDSATIASAAQSINTDFGYLDILLSNAGIVGPGDPLPSGSSLDAIERASAQTS
jgi:NAD(P)-dependent dehydrogenase (short-subunit alcohol dehydrogenase family)